MAYSTANPPVLTFSGALTRGNPNANATEVSGVNQWVYISTDAAATVNGAGYITDGVTRGMKLYDLVWIVNTTGALVSLSRVSTVDTADTAVSLTQLVAPA